MAAKAEDMLHAQVEGEKERIKQQLTPKIKAVKRSAEVALKELRDKTASMENELRDVRQELAFVQAKRRRSNGSAVFERKNEAATQITSPRSDSVSTPSPAIQSICETESH